MKEITKEMIRIFQMKKLGYDFMGYNFKRTSELSFHHLIVPHRDCQFYGLGQGYALWNGSILVQSTAHDYLHAIERLDRDMFEAITSEMIDENAMRQIRIENLKRIRDVLLAFEREYCSARTKSGAHVIKPIYISGRTKL